MYVCYFFFFGVKGYGFDFFVGEYISDCVFEFVKGDDEYFEGLEDLLDVGYVLEDGDVDYVGGDDVEGDFLGVGYGEGVFGDDWVVLGEEVGCEGEGGCVVEGCLGWWWWVCGSYCGGGGVYF